MALADFKLHEWLLNQGTGNTVPESIGGLDMVPVSGDSVQWGSGSVFGENRSFLTLGYSYYTTTSNLMFGSLINTTGLSGTLTQWSVCFVGRYLAYLNNVAFNGAFLVVNNIPFRTWNGNIDREGVTFCPAASVKYGEWAKYVVTCDGSNVRFYVNDMSTPITTTAGFNLTTGNIRMLSFNDTQYPGSMELANMTICNDDLNEADRNEYCNQFGAIPSVFSASKYNMDDFGGFLKWPEEDATTHDRSYIDVAEFEGENVYKMYADYANGGSCQAAVARRIKPNITEIHKRLKIYIPSIFDCNWFFGQTFDIFSLWTNQPDYNTDIFRFQLQQTSEGTGPLYLYRFSYRNTVGRTYIPLDGSELSKGVWHDVYFYTNITTGELILNLDGTDLINTTLSLDITPNFEYNGIYLGIHPQNAGNFFYIKDIHIGEIDYVPPVPPVPPTPPPTPTPTPTPEEPYKAIFKAACIVDSTGEPIRW